MPTRERRRVWGTILPSVGAVPTLALPFLILVAGACGPAPEPEIQADVTPESLTFLALGDSYTIGESVDSAARWPVQLAGALRAEGLAVEDPTIVARTGWTTDELAAGMDTATLQPEYDLVSLLIGVNNQYRGRELEEYRAQFVELLGRAVALAGGDPRRVLVLSIPDWGVTPFAEGRDREAIGARIDAFNAVNREESERAGAWWVDVTPVSKEAAMDLSLVAEDGLHPSGAMYRRWTEEALPAARLMAEAIRSGGSS